MISLTFSLLVDNLKAWWVFCLPFAAILTFFGGMGWWNLPNIDSTVRNLVLEKALLYAVSLFASAGIIRGGALAWRGHPVSTLGLFKRALKGYGALILYSLLFAITLIGVFMVANLAGRLAEAMPRHLGLPLSEHPHLILLFIAELAREGTTVGVMAYVISRFSLGAPLILLEGVSPSAAFGRSWDLMRRSPSELRWFQAPAVKLWGIYGFVAAISAMPSLFLWILERVWRGTDPQLLPGVTSSAFSLGAAALTALFLPTTTLVLTLTYLDRRIRHEGLDLKLKAEELEGAEAHTLPPL